MFTAACATHRPLHREIMARLLSLFCCLLLSGGAAAACDVKCGPCLACVAFNTTVGICAACKGCFAEGCSIETTDFTDGFGVLLKGAACESHALDFYGDVACKAEAITAHSFACFEVPQREQFRNCTMPALVAEIGDCADRQTQTLWIDAHT